MHIASQVGNISAIEQLLSLGTDVNTCDFRFGCFHLESSKGLTPWHYALFSKNLVMLNALLKSGALPDSNLLQQPEFNRQYQLMTRPSNNLDGSLPIHSENSEQPQLQPEPATQPPPAENNNNDGEEETDPLQSSSISYEEPPMKRARIS